MVGALVACGGGAPAGDPKAPGPGTAADANGDGGAARPRPGSGKTAADNHRDFMTGCGKNAVNSPDYCECAWGEMRKLFTDEEMAEPGEMPPAKMQTLKAQVLGACSMKVPEEAVKTSYQGGCVGDRPELQSYCECTWTEFRKRFSAAELNDEGTIHGDRFLAARIPVVKACSPKMPEPAAREAFMKGCAADPKNAPFCTCGWKELRKQLSAAEIEVGAFEKEKVFATVDKACGKLRPK